MSKGKWIKTSKIDIKIMRYLREHPKEWLTTIQISRRLHLKYNTTRGILIRFREEGKIICYLEYSQKRF